MELVLAERQCVLAGGQVRLDKMGGRLRQEDLSRVGRGRDPDDPFDVQAGVPVAVQLGRTRVHRHPHPDADAVWPLGLEDAALQGGCGTHRICGPCERDERRVVVSRQGLSVPGVPHRVTDDALPGDRGQPAVTEVVDELSGVRDVRAEQGHRSPRQRAGASRCPVSLRVGRGIGVRREQRPNGAEHRTAVRDEGAVEGIEGRRQVVDDDPLGADLDELVLVAGPARL